MDREYLAKLCEARDTLCGFCEVDECEKCIVTHLIDDAHNEMPENNNERYTAFIYEADGVTAKDMESYGDMTEAINFAMSYDWHEVVDNISGEVVWRSGYPY